MTTSFVSSWAQLKGQHVGHFLESFASFHLHHLTLHTGARLTADMTLGMISTTTNGRAAHEIMAIR